MTEYKCFLYSFLIAITLSCQDSANNEIWKEYYIPQQLEQGPVVLEYLAEIEGNKLRSFVSLQLNEDRLISYYLSPNLSINQKVVEKFSEQGSKIEEYSVYEDSIAIPCQLERGDIFSFTPLAPQEFVRYKIDWESQKDSSSNSVSKIRMFKEETNDCYKDNCGGLIFELKELIVNNRDGAFEYEANTTEHYYKNVGLVRSEKTINAQHKIDYQLQYIYEKNAFESKYGVKLP